MMRSVVCSAVAARHMPCTAGSWCRRGARLGIPNTALPCQDASPLPCRVPCIMRCALISWHLCGCAGKDLRGGSVQMIVHYAGMPIWTQVGAAGGCWPGLLQGSYTAACLQQSCDPDGVPIRSACSGCAVHLSDWSQGTPGGAATWGPFWHSNLPLPITTARPNAPSHFRSHTPHAAEHCRWTTCVTKPTAPSSRGPHR